jgi:hypothetical protein
MWRIMGVLLAVGAAAVIIGSGSVAAEGPTPSPTVATGTAAVAMGQLRQGYGASATIDLVAGIKDGRVAGNLRFYSPTYGYYNGAVRSLTISSGAIHATGAGPLIEPNGEHQFVQFTADVSADGQRVTITVQERSGESYTLSGRLDPGFVRTGTPSAVLGAGISQQG